MSVLKHATLSKWNRVEDGSYEAEIDGWQLKVAWRPERPGQERDGQERDGSRSSAVATAAWSSASSQLWSVISPRR